MKHMNVVLYTMMVGALAVGLWITITLRRENRQLAVKAQKYDEICGGVKAALYVDMTLLHDTDDPPRLTQKQVDDHRHLLYERVGNTIGGDDSLVMLGRCLPNPFPMDAWRDCAAVNNDVCLRALLKQAYESIP